MTFGDVIRSFPAPTAGAARGLTFDGKYLWYTEIANDTANQIDTDGNLLTSFSVPDLTPLDIEIVGNLLYVMGAGSGRMYTMTKEGNLIRSVALPGGTAVRGLFHAGGRRFWLSRPQLPFNPFFYLITQDAIIMRTLSNTRHTKGVQINDDLYLIDTIGADFVITDKSLRVKKRANTPGATPEGLAFDGKYLWHSNSTPGTERIYQISMQ